MLNYLDGSFALVNGLAKVAGVDINPLRITLHGDGQSGSFSSSMQWICPMYFRIIIGQLRSALAFTSD
jgi:hypothetical protein